MSGGIPDIFIPRGCIRCRIFDIARARDENSGMTAGGTPFPRLCGGGSFRSGM